MNNKSWLNGPTVLIIGLLASIIGIFSFIFGFDNIGEIINKNGSSSQLIEQKTSSTSTAYTILPSLVKAGTLIELENWKIFLENEVFYNDNEIGIKFLITNSGTNSTVFRFIPNNIELWDDVGNQYKISKGYCDSDELHYTYNIDVQSTDKIELLSKNNWCSSNQGLPTFYGSIPLNATKIYVKLKNFGPISSLIFEINL